MKLNKAVEILKERVDTNKIILNDKSYESDFDKFVKIENEAIEVVLRYVENMISKAQTKSNEIIMNNKDLEEQFIKGVLAIHVTDSQQCQLLIDYAHKLGFNIEEFYDDNYIEYPYMFIEDEEHLQANKFKDNLALDGVENIVEFEDVFVK